MTSDISRDLIQNPLGNSRECIQNDSNNNGTPEVITRTSHDSQHPQTSTYTLASDESLFSSDVDRWIHGSIVNTNSTGVQISRMAVVQRSILTLPSSFDSNGFWYAVAMVLPLMSANNNFNWICTPSTFRVTAQSFLTQLATVGNRVRVHFCNLARDQRARDIFATAMDVILFIYAIGFLILSMYQASIIG